MRLLVTGGAGFIGSAVVRRALAEGHEVLTFDKLTYAGRLAAIREADKSRSHRFVQADIADAAAVARVFGEFRPDGVLHLAAETHVDRSIDHPDAFVTTNVNGTVVLLQAALQYWTSLARADRDAFRFVHVSTDEVFGTLGDAGIFTAESRYAPNSPYAASKAAADHFARAWHGTYGLPVIVTHCSNNYGPWQHAEKFIPTVVRHAIGGSSIPIYGAGANIRDWLYVDDHAAGLLSAVRHGQAGETYLFGARCEIRNLELAKMICSLLEDCRPCVDGRSYAQQIVFVADRPGHDYRYALDPTLAEKRLSWRMSESLRTGLRKTVDWYLANPDQLATTEGRLGIGRIIAVAGTER
jgi:dTDP-glucose 4,6-dehydratase